jgi:casein kinase II subunit beta
MEKYRVGQFGKCPRAFCQSQLVLPVGLSDQLAIHSVKLYCPRCEDVYQPRSSRYHYIDGAFFGTTFPHMFFQVYPQLVPIKTGERYVPKIFGFKVHEYTRCLVSPPPELPFDHQQRQDQQQVQQVKE